MLGTQLGDVPGVDLDGVRQRVWIGRCAQRGHEVVEARGVTAPGARRHDARVATAEVDPDLPSRTYISSSSSVWTCSGGPDPRGTTNSTSASPESEPPAATFTVARWFKKKWWSPWSAGTDCRTVTDGSSRLSCVDDAGHSADGENGGAVDDLIA